MGWVLAQDGGHAGEESFWKTKASVVATEGIRTFFLGLQVHWMQQRTHDFSLSVISSKAAALIDLWVGGLTLFLRAVVPSHMVGH